MQYLLLTQYQGKILGPIAKYILGPILNVIFIVLDKLPWKNSANIGVAILLFTIVVNLLLMPLTIKQQKFSKLQMKMQPELQAIQNKYKNRKDQESAMAMNQETQAVYAKYGVSPTGSCVQMLIQMPIFFALYRVIYAIPAYVPMVKNVFSDLVNALIAKADSVEFLKGFNSAAMFTNQFNDIANNGGKFNLTDTYIDVLNRASSTEWLSIAEKYPELSSTVDKTMESLSHYNNFLGLNIGYSPSDIIKGALASGSYLLIIGAVLIPVLAAVTQWINTKLIPSNNNDSKGGNSQADQMASSMKAMNTFMPIFSAIMCFTFPAGVGLYWIAGSVVRSIQQVAINKHIDKMDLEEEIKKNVEKRNAKLKRAGIDPEKLTQNAYVSTRNMNTASSAPKNNSMAKKAMVNGKPVDSADLVASSTEYYNKNVSKPGSIAAKANMVKQYNEKNNK